MRLLDDAAVTDDSRRTWLLATLGFYLIGFSEAIGAGAFSATGTVSTGVVRALIAAVVQGAVHVVLFGVVWIWLGSKLFRGRVGPGASVRGVGMALLLPGAVAVPVSVILYALGRRPEAVRGVAITTAVLLLLALLGLVRMWFAVRRLNAFGAARTWGVMVCFPVLLLLIALVSTLFTPSN